MIWNTMMNQNPLAPIWGLLHGMHISPSLYQKVWQLLTHSQREEEKEWEETQARQVSVNMLCESQNKQEPQTFYGFVNSCFDSDW